jgi:hypothetical protein
MRTVPIGIEPQSHALVRALAEQSNLSIEEVRGIYDTQFQHLESQASVKTYLPIFAARRTREVLSGG